MYVGRAMDVGPDSFTILINGRAYLVYYAGGHVMTGDRVHVYGVYSDGVIYASYVR